jgi:hypothetical protein
VPKGEKVKVSEKELKLRVDLIDWPMAEEFRPESYKDEYRIWVLAMLDEASKGKEITITAPAPQRGGKVVDIMEALKRSMERIPASTIKTREALGVICVNDAMQCLDELIEPVRFFDKVFDAGIVHLALHVRLHVTAGDDDADIGVFLF